MSLRLRFLLSLLAVILVMAVPAFFAVNRVNVLRDMALEFRGQAARSALAVGNLGAGLLELERVQRSYVVDGDTTAGASMRRWGEELVGQESVLRAAGHADLLESADLRLNELAVKNRRLFRLMDQDKINDATDYFTDAIVPEIARASTAVNRLAT